MNNEVLRNSMENVKYLNGLSYHSEISIILYIVSISK